MKFTRIAATMLVLSTALSAALAAGFTATGTARITNSAEAFHRRAAQIAHPRSLHDAAAMHTEERARAVDRRLDGPLLPETHAVEEVRRTLAAVHAYAATGAPRYFKESLRRARHIAAWNPHGATAHARAPEDSRSIAWALALAFDWLAPKLDTVQKNLLLSPLRVRAADLYQDTTLDADSLAALAVIAVLLAGDVAEAKTWAKYAAPLAAKFHN